MGKAGRVACIITPYLLTIATLICIIVVALGCTKSSSSTLSNLYFIRVDLRNIDNGTKTDSEIEDILNEFHITSVNSSEVKDIVDQLASNEEDSEIKEFYDIGLWGYCDGDVRDGKFETTDCTKPKGDFYFDPISVWHLDSTSIKDEMPDDYNKIMKVYKAVSKWMSVAYIIAIITTVIEILVGFFAICSRWGSCVTTLFAVTGFIFTTAASVTATVLFSVFKGSLTHTLEAYGIKLHMGKNIYVATWLAVAFSLASTIFWVFSVCCCSGRSPYNHSNKPRGRGLTAEKAPYTYEALGAGAQPFGHHDSTAYPPPSANSYPMTNQPPQASPYEPFRHS
ncbi:hypothetical protein N7478_012730 [Penicillium angulare]|uniref:uncharacterized protein n=1 Tax=Penicillium angulare TaxID=116970 RepID=UPI0025417C6E|nr:uncharacterized protein N7478_012730 [Penicillium angulare]KAJ5256626.1 hypothetical protein N7478_012730 [Penicillium angulare]